jgi:hypothetical protein
LFSVTEFYGVRLTVSQIDSLAKGPLIEHRELRVVLVHSTTLYIRRKRLRV